MRDKPRVGLFVTCLVDAIRPQIGLAALKLLEEAGCDVEVPLAQTCCGQPSFNSGDTQGTRPLAQRVIKLFEPYDFTVVPSGSCGGMIKSHYYEVFANDSAWLTRAKVLAAKTYEITSFLVDVLRHEPHQVHLAASATYHDSCSGLRELGVFVQPRRLLDRVDGLEMRPLPGNNVCCGFGGTFCVKYPAISNAIVDEKAKEVERTGADLLLGGDLGCLMNIAGKLRRRGARTRVFHTIEVAAGMADGPALGEEG